MPRGRGGSGRGRGGRGRGSGRGRGGRGSGQGQSSPPPICKFFLKGTCNRGSQCRFRHEKDPMYYASIDETHDGMWPYIGLHGMMISLHDHDFILQQEEDFLDDVDNGDALLSQRENEFVKLDMTTFAEVRQSLRDRDLMMAFCVTRSLMEGVCPPIIRIERLDDTDMAELIEHKQKGNEHFVARRYQDALEEYDEALECCALKHLFISPYKQVVEVMNVLSNQAECHLRLNNFSQAASTATEALMFDADHEKSRMRRAKAELALYKSENSIIPLAQACHDLEYLLDTPDVSDTAIEYASALLDEANGFMEREKEKMAEESPNANFNFMISDLKSKCW